MPSVARVGDLSLAKVDSKTNPYANKATEKKSHAFIGLKSLMSTSRVASPQDLYKMYLERCDPSASTKTAACIAV